MKDVFLAIVAIPLVIIGMVFQIIVIILGIASLPFLFIFWLIVSAIEVARELGEGLWGRRGNR